MYSSSENCGPFSMTPLSISCKAHFITALDTCIVNRWVLKDYKPLRIWYRQMRPPCGKLWRFNSYNLRPQYNIRTSWHLFPFLQYIWHCNESYIFFTHLYTQETEPLFLFHKFICHYIDNANDIELKINETARPPLVWCSHLIFLKLIHIPDDCNLMLG